MRVLFLISIILLFPATAWAESEYGEQEQSVLEGLQNGSTENESGDPQGEESWDEVETPLPVNGDNQGSGMFMMTLQLFGGLAAVLALLYFVLKLVNKKAKNFSSTRGLVNAGGVGIGTNKSVQLVKAGDRLLVLGVGDTVTLLKEITDAEEIEKLLADERSDFSVSKQAVAGWFSRKKENPYAADSGEQFPSFLSKELDRVKQSHSKVKEALEARKK
ncbi:flagellar biosynthetic protein FliO [Bacillus daqingensis]|uniref:Flagellar biosynthetic protein FliO n=1 Tax=Bacillus daqingensis TaxID=872396 RepID=A0ABV9NTS1_9BACI